MPRIRTIKPEFWTDPKVGRLSLRARLLFIGSWNLADDGGSLQASGAYLRAGLFPYDDVTISEVEAARNECIREALLGAFVYHGEPYLYVTNWERHQRINRPSDQRAAPSPLVSEESRWTPGVLDEGSLRAHGGLTEGSPLDLDLEMEKEQEQGEANASSAVPSKRRPSGPPRSTYARLMRDRSFGAAEIAALLRETTNAADLVYGHPWFATIRDHAAWVEMQTQDRPGVDVRGEVVKAIRWLHDNPKKAGNKKDPAKFLCGWLDRARGDRSGPTNQAPRPLQPGDPGYLKVWE